MPWSAGTTGRRPARVHSAVRLETSVLFRGRVFAARVSNYELHGVGFTVSCLKRESCATVNSRVAKGPSGGHRGPSGSLV